MRLDVDTTVEEWHQAWQEQADDDPVCADLSHEEIMGSLTDADGNLPWPCDDYARWSIAWGLSTAVDHEASTSRFHLNTA